MANTYRIIEVFPTSGNAAKGVAGYFVPEFSQDAGTTWLPVHPIPFQSLTEAKQKLAKIVANEDNFNKLYSQGQLVPTKVVASYP